MRPTVFFHLASGFYPGLAGATSRHRRSGLLVKPAAMPLYQISMIGNYRMAFGRSLDRRDALVDAVASAKRRNNA
jgi:hypothetical protein